MADEDNSAGLSEWQRRWFASVREGILRDTGKPFDEWVALARACPETAHRKRLAWMKEVHGLGQNRASVILAQAFPAAASWSSPAALQDVLWADPRMRALFEAVRGIAMALPGTVLGQRKGYTAFSRSFQYAAAKPARAALSLGLAVPAGAHPALQAAKRESWSERLTSTLRIAAEKEVSDAAPLIRMAWDSS